MVAPPLSAQRADSTRAHWEANGELSFTDIAGNRSLSLLGTSVKARRVRDQRFEVELGADARYGRNEGEVAVSVYSGDVSFRFQPKRPVSPFLRATALRDGVRNLRLRLAVAAGSELNLLRSGPSVLALGLALLQDYESRALPPGSIDPSSVSSTRFNLEVRAKTPIRDGVMVEHHSMLQPVAGNFADFLFTAETTMRVDLSRRLAFQTRYQFNHDATPLPGVEFRNDRTLTIGLLVRLM